MTTFLVAATMLAGSILTQPAPTTGFKSSDSSAFVQKIAINCSKAASRVVRQKKGKLLFVKAKGNICKVTLLVPVKNSYRTQKITVSSKP